VRSSDQCQKPLRLSASPHFVESLEFIVDSPNIVSPRWPTSPILARTAAAAADTETGKTLALVHTGTREIILLLVFAAALFLDCLCLCLKAHNDNMQRPRVDHDSRFHRVHDLRRVDQRLRVPLLGLIPNNEPMLHLLPGYVVQLRARPR
jgi:hypothetical protein